MTPTTLTLWLVAGVFVSHGFAAGLVLLIWRWHPDRSRSEWRFDPEDFES